MRHDDKANKAWQKIKQERKELRDKVRAQEAEIKRLSETAASAVEAEEVARLQNAVKDYEAKLAKYDLAETAAFKERFDKPMSATLQRGVSVLVRFGKTPDEAKTLMRQLVESGKTAEQLSEMIAGEPYQLQGALVNLVAEFDELAKARADALEDWKSTQAALKVQARRDSETSSWRMSSEIRAQRCSRWSRRETGCMRAPTRTRNGTSRSISAYRR